MSDEDWDGKIERRKHLVRTEIQIFHAIMGVAAILVAQTAGIVWWAATTNERLNGVVSRVAELEKQTDDRYRAGDAIRDFTLRDQRIKRNEDDIQEIITISKEISSKVDKLLARYG